jgi:hypothetical protein
MQLQQSKVDLMMFRGVECCSDAHLETRASETEEKGGREVVWRRR